MRNLSKPIKIFVVIGLFSILFVPIDAVWSKLRPSYSRMVAPVAEVLANAFDFSDMEYQITVQKTDFLITAKLEMGRQHFQKQGLRPTDLVTYNLVLWAALFLASIYFIDGKARIKYLLIAPLILIAWHLCDLTIFSRNANWMLNQSIEKQIPGIIDYSYGWQWFWWWLFELNQKIIDPFLPLLLWIVFCFRSFFGIERKITASRIEKTAAE